MISQKTFQIHPIGIIHTEASLEEVKKLWQEGVKGWIEVFPEYKEGIKGLEGFSHIMVFAWLHKRSEEGRKILRVRHRKLLKMGFDIRDLPEVGVFATDSPDRPNLIGLSIVKVEKIEDNKIYVDGLDLYDGTPVIDIKPLTPDRVPEKISVPEWYSRLIRMVKEKTGIERI